jgi:hypothetical protein
MISNINHDSFGRILRQFPEMSSSSANFFENESGCERIPCPVCERRNSSPMPGAFELPRNGMREPAAQISG